MAIVELDTPVTYFKEVTVKDLIGLLKKYDKDRAVYIVKEKNKYARPLAKVYEIFPKRCVYLEATEYPVKAAIREEHKTKTRSK